MHANTKAVCIPLRSRYTIALFLYICGRCFMSSAAKTMLTECLQHAIKLFLTALNARGDIMQ